jgi:hypothetical protein
MTDQELQVAIDRARAFLSVEWKGYQTPLKDAHVVTAKKLEQLERVQVMRAEMSTATTLGEKNT